MSPCAFNDVDRGRPAVADARGHRRRLQLGDARIELSKYPDMSRKHLPAAVLVLIGCSMALKRGALCPHGSNDVL